MEVSKSFRDRLIYFEQSRTVVERYYITFQKKDFRLPRNTMVIEKQICFEEVPVVVEQFFQIQAISSVLLGIPK